MTSFLNQPQRELPQVKAGFDHKISGHGRALCFAGTREQLLTDIKAWIHDPSTDKPIYVLYGIAGIGKTTVAQTIAQYAADEGLLGASFFFSRAEEERKTGDHFFSTLAFQLSFHDPNLGGHIAAALLAAPDLPQKDFAKQMKYLVLEPMQHAQISDHLVIIVVDAMDECLPIDATIILRLLAQIIQSMPCCKIFITTRPEAHIETVLSAKGLLQPFYLHEIERSIAKGDIQLFLDHSLSKQQIDTILPYNQWEPTKTDLKTLGNKCGILFIMATTAVRYILDEVNRPEMQMSRLLDGMDTQEGEEGVMSSLDKMYLEILKASIPKRYVTEYVQSFQTVVGLIVVLEDLLPLSALARLLRMDESDVQITLQRLHSIMAPTSTNQAPQLYHKSFPDFITNNERCTDLRFYISSEEHHAQATQYCFKVMHNTLHRNMFDLQGIQKLKKNSEIRGNIAEEVAYACTYWATHLSKATDTNANELVKMLDDFAFTHLLQWIEVLSLIGNLEVAYPTIQLVQKFLVRDCLVCVHLSLMVAPL